MLALCSSTWIFVVLHAPVMVLRLTDGECSASGTSRLPVFVYADCDV
jgi:hypothetical protein